ncbi:hypothetical protein WN51_07624 [Melipona quadrifasciata]|uniref:Ig-like domain-containing protein n=1 Tax=Melipona quadrifasciata TaxID=166423 RepID=A0A0N0BC70_9HYME|nr:hypothetical protein WN51_07624 [Melipona quadrifasciata]
MSTSLGNSPRWVDSDRVVLFATSLVPFAGKCSPGPLKPRAASQALNQKCWQLVIKNVNVPATVKAGDTDYVILDCDYDLENTPSKGLVVKWFFNTNEVAYQWIYGREPLAGDTTRKYIDLKYKASDDPYTKYRAMKLNKPGIDLTGEYTCVIFTFADEQSANAPMVVYSTEDKFDLLYRKKTIDDKDGVEITCKAEGLYPQPTLDISIEGVPEKQTAKPTVTLRDDGLYDILSRTALLDEDLPEAAIVKCLLGIPKADYNVSHQTVYYPGTPTTTSTATTKLQHKMEIQALDNSGAGDGGGKACKFLLVYSRHHHHKPPSFMRIGNFDKIDSVVFLARGIPIPGGPVPRPKFPREFHLNIALDGPGAVIPQRRFRRTPAKNARSTRFFCLEARRFGTEEDSRACPTANPNFFLSPNSGIDF